MIPTSMIPMTASSERWFKRGWFLWQLVVKDDFNQDDSNEDDSNEDDSNEDDSYDYKQVVTPCIIGGCPRLLGFSFHARRRNKLTKSAPVQKMATLADSVWQYPKFGMRPNLRPKKWHSNTWGDKRIAIHSPHVLPVDWPEAKFFLKECSPNPSFRPIPFGIVTQLKPSQQDHIWHKIYESMYICPHLLKSKHAEKFSRRKRWLSVPLTVTGQFPHLLFPQIPFLNSDVVDRALWIDIDPSWYAYWMAIIEWQLSNGKNGKKEMAWT